VGDLRQAAELGGQMTTLEFGSSDDGTEAEKFDFNNPEDVLIEVVGEGDLDWKNYTIESHTIIRSRDAETIGAAGYDAAYGGFLDYTIQGLIDCPGEGWFVVKGVTATFHKGDGWTTDDNMDFDCGDVSAATADEIALA
jgi:hypothetical protein